MTKDKAKIALVTGASRGLGKNTALALARKGVDVIVTYRSSEAEANSVVSAIEEIGGKAIALQLDTSNTKTFNGFVAQVKQSLQDKWQTEQFDFLINNAGIGVYASFAETTEEDFDRLMNIHVKGVFFLTQKLLPLILDGGRIIKYFIRSCPVCLTRLCRLRNHEGGDRGFDPIHGEGIGTQTDCGECSRPWRN